MKSFLKKPKIRSKKHLNFLKQLNCVRCGRSPCDPHHLKSGTDSGMATKSGDNWVIPVCHEHHMEIHQKGERTFFSDIDSAKALAQKLYEITANSKGDYTLDEMIRGCELVAEFRRG